MIKNILPKLVCVFMALHIFTLSISTPDVPSDYIDEDNKLNDIECFTELLLEDCLDIELAIPESDEPDANEDDCPLEMKKIEIFSQKNKMSPLAQKANCLFDINSLHKDLYNSSDYTEITTPPPEA